MTHPDDADREKLAERERAVAVVTAFAVAMAEWEGACAVEARVRPVEQMDQNELHELWAAQRQSCQEIFDRFCTDRPRGNARPGAVHHADPSDYAAGTFRVERAAFEGTPRIQVYADGGAGRQFRFTVVKKRGQWRVDQREVWDGGRWASDRL